jgi:hypothetical protein
MVGRVHDGSARVRGPNTTIACDGHAEGMGCGVGGVGGGVEGGG